MKYNDNTALNSLNAFDVGVRIGTPLQDAAEPTNDGYEPLRNTEHVGSVLQDNKGVNDTPKDEQG